MSQGFRIDVCVGSGKRLVRHRFQAIETSDPENLRARIRRPHLMVVHGWENLQQAEVHSRAADNRRLAGEATQLTNFDSVSHFGDRTAAAVRNTMKKSGK